MSTAPRVVNGHTIEPGADLHGANLREADLIRADLSGADLSGANLSYADLHGADLNYADLRGADLRGADLHGVRGLILLPVADPRGYQPAYAVLVDGVVRVHAGCRDYTVPEARAHWGSEYAGERWIGDQYLRAIEWMETCPEAIRALEVQT